LGSLFSPQIIDLTAPGFDAPKAEQASQMLAIMMFTVPLLGLGSLTGGIQNARHRFFWPSAANGIGSIGNVIIILISHQKAGSLALAWGNLAAAFLSASITVIPVLHHGTKKLLPLNDRQVIKLISLITPFLFFGLITRSVLIFERLFASTLPDGNLSYLGYAYKISSILVVVLASSVASAIFPTMARGFARHGEKGLVEQTEYGLRLTMATALPAIAIIGVVSVPLVSVIYERGAFNHFDTLQISRILFVVMAGDVLFRMLGNMISRAFYVVQDTLTFPMISACGIVVYLIIGKFMTNTWGFVGLAISQPLQIGLIVLVTFIILIHKLPLLNAGTMVRASIFYLCAGLLAAFSAWLIVNMLSTVPALMQIVAACSIAGVVYISVLTRLDKEITWSILEMFGVLQIYRAVRVWFRLPMTVHSSQKIQHGSRHDLDC